MSFLNPFLWLGLIGVIAPLWLHLRNKPEKNVVYFSAMRFLEDQALPRRRPLQLRDILLFSLRLLALLLLVAAFSWPYLRKDSPIVVTETRVYILDNTLSNQVDDGFAGDRERIRQAIAKSGQEIQDAVIELTVQPRQLVHFSDSHDEADRKLAGLTPSFQRGSYLEAFRMAGALFDQSLGERKKIIMYGDNQENQWNECANPLPFLREVEVSMPDTPAFQERPNLFLAEPVVQRFFLAGKTYVDFAAILGHMGSVEKAVVSLRVNQQEITRQEINLVNEPEKLTIRMQWESDPALCMQAEATVTGLPDDLPADNRIYISLPPVNEGKIALMAQSPYLRTALSPDVMRGKWTARLLDPSQLASEVSANETADLLLIESHYLQSTHARALVSRYLSNGLGVILFVDRATPVINGFLRELGFEVSSPENSQVVREKPQTFRFVATDHPIFKPFLSPDFGSLVETKVFRYVRLKSSEAVPLIFSDSGDALLFETLKGRGRMLLFAFGLDRGQTELPLQAAFVPFLDLCLQHARFSGKPQLSLEPSDLCMIEVPGDGMVSQVAVSRGKDILVTARVDKDKRVQFRAPPLPGNYAITYDNEPIVQQVLSVNPSPRESQLKYTMNSDAVKSWQLPVRQDSKPTATIETRPGELSIWERRTILQQRIWWWLLVAGFGALGIEMLCLFLRKERV